MKMESLGDGALRIWMTEHDMRRWGLRFEELGAHDRATDATVTKLLQVARGRAALPETGALTVEAVPLKEGCILLFTPRRALPPCRMPSAKVLALKNANDVLQLGQYLTKQKRLPTASLYRWGEEYRLIVYPGFCAWQDLCRRLEEFAEIVGEGEGVAAFVEEYGIPVAVGDALTRLSEAF